MMFLKIVFCITIFALGALIGANIITGSIKNGDIGMFILVTNDEDGKSYVLPEDLCGEFDERFNELVLEFVNEHKDRLIKK